MSKYNIKTSFSVFKKNQGIDCLLSSKEIKEEYDSISFKINKMKYNPNAIVELHMNLSTYGHLLNIFNLQIDSFHSKEELKLMKERMNKEIVETRRSYSGKFIYLNKKIPDGFIKIHRNEGKEYVF